MVRGGTGLDTTSELTFHVPRKLLVSRESGLLACDYLPPILQWFIIHLDMFGTQLAAELI